MEHAALLAAFGEKIGIDCSLNDQGLAILDMGEGILVYLESQEGERQGTLLMQTGVGRIGENPDPELVKSILQTNMFYRGGPDIVAALDPTSDDLVILCALDEQHCTLEAFEEALDALVYEASQWQDILAGTYEDRVDAAPMTPAPDLTDTRLFTPGTFA